MPCGKASTSSVKNRSPIMYGKLAKCACSAAKSKVITRMGNQIHSHSFYRTAVQLIQKGAIGKVQRVHSWVAASGHGKSGHIDRPTPAPVPNTLAWDLWLGVAPERPYVEGKVYHPWGWRDWLDFGNGALGDFGCHISIQYSRLFASRKLPPKSSVPIIPA